MRKPTLEEVMSDAEFRNELAADGLPALYTRAPRWPWDPRLLECLAEGIDSGTARVMMAMAQPQMETRQRDDSHRHMCLLMKREGATKRRPAEWPELVLTPAGIKIDAVAVAAMPDAPVTANEFGMLAMNKFAYDPRSGIRAPPEAKVCDECGAITTCECACGEAFCCRDCLRAGWREHAGICWTVYDNGRLGYSIFTPRDLGSERGPLHPPRTNRYRCTVCDKPGARKKCASCSAFYCSRYCQTLDWRQNNHRQVCAPGPAIS